jgi:uncharacterized protein YaaR (DUF327 family)
MLKVDDSFAAGLAGAALLKPAKADAKKNERPKKLFSTLLKKQASETSSAFPRTDTPAFAGIPAGSTLESLLDSLHDAGDALAKRPFPDEIRRYRLTIQNFMRYVLDKAYDVKDDEGIPNYLKEGLNVERFRRDPELRKKRQGYSTVQIIDQKLDRLAADIMTGQVKQLGLLESIEEINGLLVDLLE